MSYLKNAASVIETPPQTEPLDERQVKNSAGGYSYGLDEWKQLDRFLILGSEGGSYYASEQELTVKNIKAVAECVKNDGLRTVARIVEISDGGRAPKNDPALLALAYAAGKGDDATRSAALDALPKVARISTHLFHFCDFVQEFRGWGRGLKNAVANWYINQDANRLADQVTKYQQRDGWRHRDLLRLTHPKLTGEHQAIARWVVKGDAENVPDRIAGHIKLQAAKSGKEAASLVREYGLVRESVPTDFLNEVEVWEALLEKMPMTAMIRNLGKMSSIGLLSPLSDAAGRVVKALGNEEAIKKARVHPIQVLAALQIYAYGSGHRGNLSWTPVPQVTDALDEAFYTSFQNVEPTGKNFYLGLDVSGSMGSGYVANIPGLSPQVASAAMAMVTARSEKNYYVGAFTNGIQPLAVSSKQRLDDILRTVDGLSFGGTDCALPILDATEKKMKVDTFVVYTDSETWAGRIHPKQALDNYRQKTGIPAKLIVVGMVSNGFTIADPKDAGMLDVVGFDTATPQVISEF